jgi:MFS family permease
MGVVSMPAMLAPILGPVIGGVILQSLPWSWIFFVNVPIGVIAVVTALRILPAAKAAARRALDYLGLTLMVTGFPLLTYGLAEIGTTGSFTSLKVILPCASGLALIAVFALHALSALNPLLNLRLYRRPTFSTASIAMFLLSAALFGGMILMPL